jgi:hypothetical protein
MGIKDLTRERLLKARTIAERYFWGFLGLFILILIYFFIEQLSWPEWYSAFAIIGAIDIISLIVMLRLNRELKRREAKEGSDQ